MHKTFKITVSDKNHYVLDIFSHRINGLDTPEECASALLAALDIEKYSSYSPTSESPFWLNAITFNSGSWALSPWQAGEHVHSHFTLQDNQFKTPLGTFDWEEFQSPNIVQGSNPHLALKSLQNDKNTDLTFMSILVGILDNLLPLDFPTKSAYAHINTTPIFSAARACLLALKPWAEQRTYPSRGHNARPFPLQASVKRAYSDVFKLIIPTFYGMNRKNSQAMNWFLQNFVQAHILAPNKPFNATTWIKGTQFDTFKDSLPQDLIALGQSLAPVLPMTDLTDDDKALFEEGTLPEMMSAHHHIQLQSALLNPVLHLKEHAPKNRKRGGRLNRYPFS